MKALALLLLLAGAARAEDLMTPLTLSTGTAVSVSTAAAKAPPSAFARAAARRLDVPAEDVARLQRKGYAKTEILSFIAIVKASKKPWEDVAKVREEGTPLRRMAEEAGLDYDKLFDQSTALKAQIEKALAAEPPTP